MAGGEEEAFLDAAGGAGTDDGLGVGRRVGAGDGLDVASARADDFEDLIDEQAEADGAVIGIELDGDDGGPDGRFRGREAKAQAQVDDGDGVVIDGEHTGEVGGGIGDGVDAVRAEGFAHEFKGECEFFASRPHDQETRLL